MKLNRASDVICKSGEKLKTIYLEDGPRYLSSRYVVLKPFNEYTGENTKVVQYEERSRRKEV